MPRFPIKLKSPRPAARLVSAYLRSRWTRRRQKSLPTKLRVLREVYADYKALRGPRPGFWARVAAKRPPITSMALNFPSLAPGSSLDTVRGSGPGANGNSTNGTTNNTNNAYAQQETLPGAQTTNSRRQRLLGFARATRDTYIPRLATSVTLLASGVPPRSLDILYDEYGLPVSFPGDTTFTLFPAYTRLVSARESPAGHEGYVVGVRGWMWCPGLMLRKNRLVLSLAKQVAKGRSLHAAQTAVDRLHHDPALTADSVREPEPESLNDSLDTESVTSSTSVPSSTGTGHALVPPSVSESVLASADQLIKDRIGAFIARLVPRAQLKVVVGSVDPRAVTTLCEKKVCTDANGHFECEIFMPYEPSAVQVTALADDTITACQEVHIMPSGGLGVISDIDDTVKLTGVIGDKRELLSKILVGNVLTWNIPAVVAWYQHIATRLDATFHYVSNSPWQLFSLISQYFDCVKLPRGSVHLKQYSGNIITSLMEPSSSRKSAALRKILADFPEKRFICIGDSGEQDMEAYTELAKAHPHRIAGIFIRAVPGSFSNIEDAKVLTELKWMAADWAKRQKLKFSSAKTMQHTDLIDLSEPGTTLTASAVDRLKKLPPLVPRKPSTLRGEAISKLPPLPERKYLFSNENTTPDSDIDQLGLPLPPPLPIPLLVLDDLLTRGSANSFALPSQEDRTTPPPPPPPRRRKPPMEDSEYKTSINLDALGKRAGERLSSSYGVSDFFELEDVDGKAALWIQRVQEALHDLDGTDTKLAFFEDSDEDFFKTALENL